jgi:hypothetical protein
MQALIDLLLAYLINGKKPQFNHGRHDLVESGLIMMNNQGVFMGEHLVYVAGLQVIDREKLLNSVYVAFFSESNPNQSKGKLLDLFVALRISLHFGEFVKGSKHLSHLDGKADIPIPIHDRRYAKLFSNEDFSKCILLSPEKNYNGADVNVFNGEVNFYITLTTFINSNLSCQVGKDKREKQTTISSTNGIHIRLELPFSEKGNWNDWKSENPTSNLFVMNLNDCDALCGEKFVNSYKDIVTSALTKYISNSDKDISVNALKTCLTCLNVKYRDNIGKRKLRDLFQTKLDSEKTYLVKALLEQYEKNRGSLCAGINRK